MDIVGEATQDTQEARARMQRERNVHEATTSVMLEGFTFSPEQDADFAAYIRGEITIEEVGARTRARHGRRTE